MKRSEQLAINEEVIREYEMVKNIIPALYSEQSWKLRSCSAKVYNTECWYVLRSYGTVVAVIDKKTDTLYDFLRYVYGYTATSAQHITKFKQDYGNLKWGCERELRYYPL